MGSHPRTPKLERALRESRALTKAYGTSYYFSTLLFPPETRDAIFALYALVRKADEIVDTVPERAADTAAERLDAFDEEWRQAYARADSTDPVLYAAAWVFHTYAIPFEYSDAFFAAMRADTVTFRYATYADLEGYMYGSAAVVGHMLTCIISTKAGVSIADARKPAESLAYAMQLTNFLRDIHEDYAQRGRIYLPQDELTRFGVTERMIAEGKVTPEFEALMRFQITRARALYAEADTGIPLLAPAGRKPVRLARVLYSKILDRIERAGYDVFSARRYTTRMQKIRSALPVLVSR